MRLRTIFISLIFLPVSLCSQAYLPVERITEKQGLPIREINYIFKDSRGFMWFATSYGLSRFDGAFWLTYKHEESNPNSLPHNHARWIMEDDAHKMLIGTPAGIVFFDPVSQHFELAKDFKTGKTIAIPGTRLFPSSDGHWYTICTPESGERIVLMRYQGNGSFESLGEIYLKDGYKSWLYIRPLWEDEAGNNWLFSEYAYFKLNIPDLSWNTYYWKSDLPVQDIDSNFPMDRQGRFWFPTMHPENGPLFQHVQLPKAIPIKDWFHFYIDNKANLWVKEKHGNLYHLDVKKQQLEEQNYLIDIGAPVGNIFEEQNKSLWIPTTLGVNKHKRKRQNFENYLNNPRTGSGDQIGDYFPYAIVEDQEGQIVILTGVNGVLRLDPASKIFVKIDFKVRPEQRSLEFFGKVPPNFHGSKMLIDEAGYFWVNLRKGTNYILRFHSKTSAANAIEAPESMSAILQYTKDQFITTSYNEGKLYWFNPKTEEFVKNVALALPALTGVLYKQGPAVWASSETGVVCFNPKTKAVREYGLFSGKNYQTKGRVFSILVHQGYVWLGTPEGLIRLDPDNGQFKVFLTADGLPHDIVYTILPDREFLWLGTNKGLCRFDTKTLQTTNYYEEDGLTHAEFNRWSALISREGKYYFGGMNGINAFYPTILDAISAKQPAPLIWTQFSKVNVTNDSLIVNNGYLDIDPGAPVELNHLNRNISFRFAMLEYLEPGEHKYFYYLDGYEHQWNYGGNNPVVTYLSIPPGKYTLRVKAQDKLGNAAANEMAIPIIMYRAWYLRWWAFALYGLAIISIVSVWRNRELQRILSEAESHRLQELDALKSRLYNNITHEFRTPLTLIIGMADEIAEQPLNAKNMIKRHARKLLHLVQQMLDLAKLESGKQIIQAQQSDIVSYLGYLVEVFQSSAAGKNIQLTFQSSNPALQMTFDAEKIQHVVANLLSNALKFTPEGGAVQLQVSVQDQGAGHSDLCIEVMDNGLGISQEDQLQIFDRYYQVDHSATQISEGVGLGLALSKELVLLMNGQLSVESDLGKGSKFRLILPIVQDKALAQKAGSADLSKTHPLLVLDWSNKAGAEVAESFLEAASHFGLDGLPLALIIEDNMEVAAYIQTCLRAQYQTILAKDGHEGIEIALETIPDIIVSDVMMPRKDGFEVTQFLKNDERSSHIPIILLTAKADVESRIKGLQRGADAYLAKPFEKKELLVRLGKLIELRQRLQARYSNPSLLSSFGTDPQLQIEDTFLQKIKAAVEKDITDASYGVPQLCADLHMSRPQIYRKIKALTNRSIASYIRLIRLLEAKNRLQQTGLSISEIAYQVGFSDASYFTRTFTEEFGHTPTDLRA